MEMIVCPNCNKLTGYKRNIGFGTFFAVLITFGFWLFVLPFYPKRCITCGLTKSASVPWHQTWKAIALVLFVVLFLIGVFGSKTRSSHESAADTAALPAAVSVPFVGCESNDAFSMSDGPTAAPKGNAKLANIDLSESRRLAYYQGPVGVLAPRGWYCFGASSASSATLFVTPQLVRADDWKDYRGPLVSVTEISGSTSGRFAVARVIARVFPAHMAFVKDVLSEGGEPASTFPVGPFPTDKARSQTDRVYEYQTPPNSEGIGGNNKSEYPWDGVVILQGQTPDVLRVTVGLPNELRNLTSAIIKQAERDSHNSEEGQDQATRVALPPTRAPCRTQEDLDASIRWKVDTTRNIFCEDRWFQTKEETVRECIWVTYSKQAQEMFAEQRRKAYEENRRNCLSQASQTSETYDQRTQSVPVLAVPANTSPTNSAFPSTDATQRDQIWQTIQAWAHSIEIADLDQFRTFYADQLEQYYGKVNVSLSDVLRAMASKTRDYTALKLRIWNPSFSQVAPNLVQVDYDKKYKFTAPNARPNEGETKASLRLVPFGDKWVIVAEFDRQVCWSTLMRDPSLQSPPGRCR